MINMMSMNLINIYKSCTTKCINNFNNFDLIDSEKICLSKCFDRKSEVFNMSTTSLIKYSEVAQELEKKSQGVPYE